MTLTEDQETTTYRATMEVGTNTSGEVVDDYEESVFLYIDQVRDNTNTTANTTNVPGISDAYTARLNGSQAGRTVGPAKMIVVNPGDQVDVSVDYYHGGSYTDTGAESKANMVSAISGLFGGASTGTLQETAVFNQFNAPLASAAAYVGTRGDANKPRAYLNVVVFDKDFNLMSTGSAFKQTQSQSGFGALSHNITLAEGGYVYVYLSNESQTDFNVHFDNLEIEHTNGTILQEDHYYPFGLQISALSSKAPLSKPNKYNTFQGQERIEDFDLGWYSYKYRNHDPTIGRFFNVDPLAESFYYNSTYAFSENKVTSHIELEGAEALSIKDHLALNGSGGVLSFIGDYLYDKVVGGTQRAAAGLNKQYYNNKRHQDYQSGNGPSEDQYPAALESLNHKIVDTQAKVEIAKGFADVYEGFSTVQNVASLGTVGAIKGIGNILRKNLRKVADPSDMARAAQGSGSFPGVDSWRNITLKKGEDIVGGLPGQSNFYSTTRGALRTNLSSSAYSQGVQVPPHPQFGYRPSLGIYKVTQNTRAAMGVTYANPQHGAGGLPQIYVPQLDNLKLIRKTDLGK